MKFFELAMPNSKVMMIQFAPKTADPKVHGHGLDYQLSIPLAGSPFIQYNHEVRKFEHELWCITAPGEQHYHYSNEEGAKLLLINLSQSFLDHVLTERLEQPKREVAFFPWVEGSAEGFKKLVMNVMKQSLDRSLDSGELYECEYEMATLLFSLGKGSHSDEWKSSFTSVEHPALRKALQYIHDDYVRDLNLDTLERESGLSKYYLIRLFKEYMGVTPSRYISEVRLTQAEYLLRNTSAEITDVAFEVGFGSLNTFERLFKQKYQTSASEFRKRL